MIEDGLLYFLIQEEIENKDKKEKEKQENPCDTEIYDEDSFDVII